MKRIVSYGSIIEKKRALNLKQGDLSVHYAGLSKEEYCMLLIKREKQLEDLFAFFLILISSK